MKYFLETNLLDGTVPFAVLVTPPGVLGLRARLMSTDTLSPDNKDTNTLTAHINSINFQNLTGDKVFLNILLQSIEGRWKDDI